ncbi:hypothetical protein EDF73_11139 [Raoultella sp. BIGb0138]|uniref:hypothetical protein n=1 Tax=Raoultella sp. BIGb0138 TaxID=2485115 RepID=UPI00104D0647|nr:hypothetical protein [Raoultella sp. BIGb0138]TCW08516.1 hypothetical protein EDF73_11139 [Raoultella sp. BIGb0138]
MPLNQQKITYRYLQQSSPRFININKMLTLESESFYLAIKKMLSLAGQFHGGVIAESVEEEAQPVRLQEMG